MTTDELSQRQCGVILYNKAGKIIGVRVTESEWPSRAKVLSETLTMLPGPLMKQGATRFAVTTVYRAMLEALKSANSLLEFQTYLREWKKLGLSFELLQQAPVELPTFGMSLRTAWKNLTAKTRHEDSVDLENISEGFVSEPPPEWAAAIHRIEVE